MYPSLPTSTRLCWGILASVCAFFRSLFFSELMLKVLTGFPWHAILVTVHIMGNGEMELVAKAIESWPAKIAYCSHNVSTIVCSYTGQFALIQ